MMRPNQVNSCVPSITFSLTFSCLPHRPGDLWRHCGGLGKEILMPYPINQSWREQIELNWIGARVGLWDTTLKFLSPGPCNDVTDHLGLIIVQESAYSLGCLFVVIWLQINGYWWVYKHFSPTYPAPAVSLQAYALYGVSPGTSMVSSPIKPPFSN